MSTKHTKLVSVSTDISDKNQDDCTEQKQLNSVKSVELMENDQNTSIFDLPAFPSATKRFSFTPQDLKNALKDYESTTRTLDDVFKDHGVTLQAFYCSILAQYEEIRTAYCLARTNKAQRYGAAAQKIFEDLPDKPEFYTYDRSGNKCLSTAGVRFLELRHASMMRQAQIHETGSFVPASKQETISKNISFGVTLQGKLPGDFDITTAGPESILSVLKNKGSNGKK